MCDRVNVKFALFLALLPVKSGKKYQAKIPTNY